MDDYRKIKYTNCHLGFLKCEDCAFKGNCKERFNCQCMANHQAEYIPLYGTDDKNYHFVLCEKDEFEKLDEKDKAGFISYLTDLYNFLYVHNADIRVGYTPNSVTMRTIEKKLESIDDWAECLKMNLEYKYGNTFDDDDVIPIEQIQRLVKEIKENLERSKKPENKKYKIGDKVRNLYYGTSRVYTIKSFNEKYGGYVLDDDTLLSEKNLDEHYELVNKELYK